jgi:hypothetical protein
MPLPSSGQISVSDINTELGRASNTANSNFAGGTTPQSGSLFKLGEAGGINQTAPHAMSEWYSYDHGLGLSSALATKSGQYNCSSYESIEVDLTNYIGNTVKIVIHYVSGSDYTGDVQVDDITLWNDSKNAGQPSYGFSNSANNFQTSTTDTASYSNVTWSYVADGTTQLRWNRDSGGTPSSNTGLAFDAGGNPSSPFYLYAEASNSGYPSKNFWLRSPNVSVTSTYHNLEVYLARCGSTIGTVKIHVDVVS